MAAAETSQPAPTSTGAGMLKVMEHANVLRIGVAVLGLCAALPALADTQFRVRQMTRDDVPLGKGQCDIRLQVDNQVEVAVRRDTVSIRTISGRGAYDDGSECNAPLPDRDIQNFGFRVVDSRGDIRLLSEPSRRNNYAAVVMIRDSSGGQGRYHFRLTWAQTGGDYRTRRDFDDRPGGAPPVPGFSWNNTIDFRGNGRGTATLNRFDRRLFNCTVNIDRGGRIVVSFRTDRGPMNFTGRVTSRDGDRLRADVVSDDGRLRGPMFISTGRRDNIDRITLEATDGRDRLRLNWDRR
jgi:hypothetical protein